MHRRRFLQGTMGILGAMLFSRTMEEDAAASQRKPHRAEPIPLCLCLVAGVKYHAGARRTLLSLRSGQDLSLRREPNNSHDPKAIAVYTEHGTKLGFLPQRLNEIPANLMDSGHSVAAKVLEVNRFAEPWEALVIQVGVA